MPDISSISSTPTSPYLNNKAELMETNNVPRELVENADNDSENATEMSRQSSKYRTSNPVSSHVFLISAYEQILEAKSVRRYPELKSETIRALDLARSQGFSKDRASLPHNIDVIMQPFLSSCKTDSQTLTLIGLDGLSKLISYDYLADQNFNKEGQFKSSLAQPVNKDGTKQRGTMEKAVLAICGCFVCETTEDKVQTQVIKGLMSAVSSATTPIHQEALLNAIRTLYNIFLLSRDINNQIIAQGTLVQMARTVFGRVDLETLNSTAVSRTISKRTRKPRTNAEVLSNLDGEDEDSDRKDEAHPDLGQLSLEAIGGKAAEAAANSQVQGNICDTNSDLDVLDAFLLFRALCKLSVKPYQADGSSDVRCMSLRSKLLSLYLILTTVTEFPSVFTKSKVFFVTPNNDTSAPRKIREETFLNAVKPYLCISLSRNLVSTLPKVYEMTLAVFELFVTTMRHHLKREIEVILKEIIIPILEMKPTGNQHQKHLMLAMLITKICTDSQLLVDIYLNYDCGRGSLNNNIFERLTSALSKLTLPSRSSDSEEQTGYLWDEIDTYYVGSNTMTREDLVNLPPLTSDRFTGYFMNHSFFSRMQFTDANLQQRSLECLVGILKSLVQWSNRGLRIVEETNGVSGRSSSMNGKLGSTDDDASETSQSMISEATTVGDMVSTIDDPTQFEKIKIQKQTLRRGIELFNRKPKKGIESLLADEIIESDDPRSVATFLLNSPDLDKSMVGEYLGDGDKYNVSIMHEFVDQLQFKELEFVPALRHFLAGFRLPGEAQKIDRFMLKFAERYVEQNPTMFSNADCAYVLAYSVIMLNTDLHNPQVKHRMTKSEFIKNNRGINDSADLPEELLQNIYDQIANSEIKLKDDVSSGPAPTPSASTGVLNTGLAAQFDILGTRSRKANDIATANSKRMSSNAERYLTKMLSRKSYMNEMGGMSIFYSASHFEHVKPMFEASWMAVLAAISGPLKDSELSSVVSQCLDGFRYAVHIAGFFDLDLARSAFVTTLGNFSFLSDISEMRPKNVEAIKAILDIAVAEGNYLKGAWNDVLQVVNHLVRLQLVPNFSATTNGRDRSLVAHRDSQIRQVGQIALLEGNSQNMLIAVDKVFASSVYLNGPAIVDFIRALASISWTELENMPKAFDRSRAQSSPRMFSIQKVVEVAYYNMNRIRLEWKEMWTVLGPLFNQVGCHRNEVISAFAVDSLRQLAMKFLEKPELSHYQFQKVFLMPFAHIIVHNPNESIKDMVLQCITQMLRTYRENIRSGWFTILEILSRAAGDRSDEVVRQALHTVKGLSEDSFYEVTHPEVFPVYLNCLAQFAKHPEYQKLGLQALDTFKVVCDRVIMEHEEADKVADDAAVDKEQINHDLTYYNPIFQNLMTMVMEVLDLEIRSKSMDLMFEYLHQHGSQFPPSFWHHILDDVLFPLFSDLGKLDHKVRIRFASREDSMVWLSTTLVQALAKFVNLFTVYFNQVFQFLNGLLDLLSVCLCQDNPTLVKIGSDCLKSLVEKNVEKLSKPDWERILSIIIRLFKATTRIDLTDKSVTNNQLTISSRGDNRASQDWLDNFDTKAPVPLVPTTPAQQLNLGLTMVNLVEDTFLQHDAIFNKLDPTHIFVILDVVERSYLETQAINSQFDLKSSIERQAVTKMEKFAATSLSLELSSLVCLIKVLLKMYIDEAHHYAEYRTQIETRLIPLCKDSFHQFNLLSAYPMAPGLNNIYQLWHQVILRIGTFLCKASGPEFMTVFAPSSTEIITTLKHQHLSPEVQAMLFQVMSRVDLLYIHATDSIPQAPEVLITPSKLQARSTSSSSSYHESN